MLGWEHACGEEEDACEKGGVDGMKVGGLGGMKGEQFSTMKVGNLDSMKVGASTRPRREEGGWGSTG